MEVEADGTNLIKLTTCTSNFQLLMLGRETVIHNRPAATRRDRASTWAAARRAPRVEPRPARTAASFWPESGVW